MPEDVSGSHKRVTEEASGSLMQSVGRMKKFTRGCDSRMREDVRVCERMSKVCRRRSEEEKRVVSDEERRMSDDQLLQPDSEHVPVGSDDHRN